MSTYLYRIALFKNRAKRNRKESLNVPLDSAYEQAGLDRSSEHDLRISLQAALNNLPQVNREAFLLVKVEGLSTADAAKAQRVPVGTLKFRVHRAMKALQLELGESLTLSPRTQVEINKEISHAL